MNETLFQRLKNWACRKFGHKAENPKSKAWEFNGHRYHRCARCGYAVARPLNSIKKS